MRIRSATQKPWFGFAGFPGVRSGVGGGTPFAYPTVADQDYELWLTGEDGNGVAPTDSSWYSHELTAASVFCETAQQKFETGAIAFASSELITTDSSPSLGAFNFDAADWTVEGWIRPPAVMGYNGIFELREDADKYILLYHNNGAMHARVRFHNGTIVEETVLSAAASITAESWNHVRLAYNHTTKALSLQVGGVELDSGTTGTAAVGEMDYRGIAANINYIEYFPTIGTSCHIDELLVIKNHFIESGLPTAPISGPTTTSFRYASQGLADSNLELWLDGEQGNGAAVKDVSNSKVAVTPAGGGGLCSTAYSGAGSGSIYFDGVDDSITLDAINALALGTDWTIDFWVKHTSTQAGVLLNMDDSTSNLTLLWDVSDTLTLQRGGGGGANEVSSPSLTAGSLHFVRISHDASENTVSLYVNSSLAGAIDVTTMDGDFDTYGPQIGASGLPLSEMAEGYIDNFVIISGFAFGAGQPSDLPDYPTQVAPVADTVTITGTPRSGVQLNGSFNYSDGNNDPAGTHLYQWHRANNGAGSGDAAIAGATSINYTPVLADVGKFLRLGVTPVNAVAPTTGTQVFSAYTSEILAAQPTMDLTVTGTSGTINWCGQTWNLPADSGVTKEVSPTRYQYYGTELTATYQLGEVWEYGGGGSTNSMNASLGLYRVAEPNSSNWNWINQLCVRNATESVFNSMSTSKAVADRYTYFGQRPSSLSPSFDFPSPTDISVQYSVTSLNQLTPMTSLANFADTLGYSLAGDNRLTTGYEGNFVAVSGTTFQWQQGTGW